MALGKTADACSCPCLRGLTPPDSPSEGPQTPDADLKHLFQMLVSALSGFSPREPPSTPISQGYFPPSLDVAQLQQLLVNVIPDGYPSVEATEPAQSSLASNVHEKDVQAAEIDLQAPILTSANDFQSFKKWASHAETPQFKTVVERYDKQVNRLLFS